MISIITDLEYPETGGYWWECSSMGIFLQAYLYDILSDTEESIIYINDLLFPY